MPLLSPPPATMLPTMSRASTGPPDEDIGASTPAPAAQQGPSAVPADPETLGASPLSPTSPPMQPFPPTSLRDHTQDLDSVPDLPVSRSIREFASRPPAQARSSLQQIRRKPLSPTASSAATRYSSGEYLTIKKSLPMPEHRFSRSYSVDSPTVYDFPHPIAPRANSKSSTKPQTTTANKE